MMLLLDIIRGAAIAVAATLAARALMTIIHRRWVMVILVSWVVIPALAVAYVWAALPLDVFHQPWAAQLLHVLLSAGRLALIAVVIVACVPPPPLDAVAYHCWSLAGRRKKISLFFTWWSAGPGRQWLVTCLLLFPLAFSEFELASRLNIGGWAVRLFDAQAGGQFLSVTLMQAAPGVFVQLTVLGLAWWLLRHHGTSNATPAHIPALWLRVTAWIIFVSGSLGLLALPLITLLLQASSGWMVALSQAINLRSEITASLLFAGTAACCTWLIAGFFSARPPSAGSSRLWLALLVLPGLCGSLVIGLIVLACCQLSWLRALSDTPVPMLSALVVLLLPYAVVLRWMCAVPRSSAAWHQALLLDAGEPGQRDAARQLRWSLVGRQRWWSLVLLFIWGYCDLAASAILHPMDMTPVLVRLYNLMHYGQSTALSVQLMMTLLAPLLLIALVYVAWRLPPWQRLRLFSTKSGQA